jgi:hypothetical protein
VFYDDIIINKDMPSGMEKLKKMFDMLLAVQVSPGRAAKLRATPGG